ncbi:MAG: DUF5320 domain-containing protein [Proteobacteria bacterium]|nr:DUF5320 domain-containing protein [Pseudomonadota bacterium]
MPGFDRSGPSGAGPLTGGGFGFCAQPDSAGGHPMGMGRGMGRACRRGGCWGRGFGRGMAWNRDDVDLLEAQAQSLRRDLAAIEKELAELEAQDK